MNNFRFATPAAISEITALYASGKSTVEIGKMFGVSDNCVSLSLQRNGIVIRTAKERSTKFTHDPLAFQTPYTDETAYWVGFILADGCINDRSNSGAKELSVSLQKQDRSHLETLLRFLKSNHSIRDYSPTQSCRFSIRSDELCDSLLTHGIFPRKSIIATAPEHFADNIHFWRGVVDGDGCLGFYNKRAVLMLLGGETLLTQFQQCVNNNLPHISANILKTHHNTGLRQIRFNGKKAIEVMDLLYKTAPIYLDRKFEKYNEIRRNYN